MKLWTCLHGSIAFLQVPYLTSNIMTIDHLAGKHNKLGCLLQSLTASQTRLATALI